MKILVTGAAGFIGFHLAEKLVSLGHSVIGIDNINDYYDINLKYARLHHSGIKRADIEYNKKIDSACLSGYTFLKLDMTDMDNISGLFKNEKFDCVCNLAAQAGVRYSIDNPRAYIDSNICGFFNILESCRSGNIRHLVFASSSSVYGMNGKIPFSVTDSADHPLSLYAATKKSNELMSFAYSRLYNIPCTALRFFTVYGPWGRPDMAYYKFAEAILDNKPIEVYNNGNMSRDFTYIADITKGITAAINRIPNPFAVYNLGSNVPVKLTDFISVLENALGIKAQKTFLPMQAGDIPVTMADIDITARDLGWEPETTVEEGLKLFTDWLLSYKKNND